MSSFQSLRHVRLFATPCLCNSMNRSTPGLPVNHQLPEVHPNPCPLSWWCHPTISSSVVPFSSCPQSFPASGSFQMSQLFASGGQSIGVWASTSVLTMNGFNLATSLNGVIIQRSKIRIWINCKISYGMIQTLQLVLILSDILNYSKNQETS